MGASSTTPHVGLPQFADGDKPTWRGDINGAMTTLDNALYGKADKTTLDFYFKDYNVVADGSDQTAHVQACIDAAAVNGGVVHPLRAQTVSIAGEVFIKGGVVFAGDTGNYNGVTGASNTPVFRFINDNARIRYGAYAGNAGSAHGDQPGKMSDVLIDGNGHGSISNLTTGALYVECTGFNLNNVEVINYAGIGQYFQAAQNGEVIGCDVRGCGMGVGLDNGSGGIDFIRCEYTGNARGGATLDDPGKANAYPFGPAHIKFDHCIFENYAAYDCNFDITCGSVFFDNCDFSNNVLAANNSRGTLVDISNPVYTSIASYAIFDSCIFAGGTDAGTTLIRLTGTNQFYIYGETYIQKSAAPFVQNGGFGIGQIDGPFIKGGGIPSSLISAINSGSLLNWYNVASMTKEYVIDPAVTSAAIYTKILGDVGVRGYIAANGSINWCSGANFNQLAAIGLSTDQSVLLYYSPTLNHQFQGSVSMPQGMSAAAGTFTGKVTEGGAKVETFGNSVPNGAVTIDASVTKHQIFSMTGGANISALTITNPVAGSILRITYNLTSATYAALWPTGAVPGAGLTFPASLVGPGLWSIEFVYSGAAWLEMGRNF